MQIENTNDLKCDYIKTLLLGPSGAGKTTTLGTLPPEKTLIISAESGLLSIKGTGIDVVDISRNIVDGRPVVIEDMGARIKKLGEVYKWALAGFPDDKGKPTFKYESIALDSINEFSELGYQKALKEFPDRKDSFAMWGEYNKIMKNIVRSFRDLPMNVFFTALTDFDKDDMGKRYIAPQIPGAIAKNLNQYFDFVFYVHVDSSGVRTLQTRSTDVVQLKDRSRKLDAAEQPNLSAIMKKIMEEKK